VELVYLERYKQERLLEEVEICHLEMKFHGGRSLFAILVLLSIIYPDAEDRLKKF